MRIESAGPAEMLLHPGDRLVAHAQRLLHHDPDKGAERTGHDKKEDQERECSAQRLATAKQARDPAIKWLAQPGEQGAEEKWLQKRPHHREEKSGCRQHQEEDKRRPEARAADIGGLHEGSMKRSSF